MGNSPSNHGDQRRRRSTATTTGPRPIAGRSTALTQMIPDQFSSMEQVTAALRRNGLESCNLIVGMDFTKSNEWSGKRTFGGRSLHTIDDPTVTNPYEDVIESIGQTLRDFDEDNVIPVYGFGDELTADNSVFTFGQTEQQPGFPLEGIRSRYREIVPNVVMAGPTSFAPIINQAVSIVNQTGQYHILVIIADGQVTRSVDIPAHAVSKNEKETIDAITYASNFPLSIIMVGVGDGPWESMIYFDNYLVHRKFDNFQFVEFHKIASSAHSRQHLLTQFALHALMEVPEQYQVIKEMGYLSKGPYQFARNVPQVMVFPAPQNVIAQSSSCSTNYSFAQPAQHNPLPVYSEATMAPAAEYPSVSSGRPSAPTFISNGDGLQTLQADTSAYASRPGMPSRQMSQAEIDLSRLQESLLCCICEDRKKDTVFQCGHETCEACASLLTQCPTCRQPIQVRIRRYGL
ncbi:hypothetical protein Poli38472_006877 [Pythium oligandrum]|uniref:RING-type domain-containing protein n=1 Tax=Pythium oligandrum TaxID=41045 RepID=A0A8K1FEP8_PYTOL|nr:hypothetical protein Poli38472_006877 [Pythium oligandrum]|eukprot:TMW56867.1 hypothetical protein Poli38472_006877 [Pythium oligandrum]